MGQVRTTLSYREWETQQYCHRKIDNPYSAVFWVGATTKEKVKESFHSISERIKKRTDYLPDMNARVAFFLRKFTSWTIQWLMVFDNYDNPDTYISNNFHVYCITRYYFFISIVTTITQRTNL